MPAKRPRDVNELAKRLVDEATGEADLTMRMSMWRFTRLTDAFSKKAENLAAAVSLHFLHYNFARPHKSLSKPYPTTPAHGSRCRGSRLGTLEEVAGLLH